MIDNIAYANELNNYLSTEIEPLLWGIVAGKVSFEESRIDAVTADIRDRMNVIKSNTFSVENRGIMEVSLRAMDTLDDYLSRLKVQIDNREPVAENELLLEEIRVCVEGINDLIREYSSKQLLEVGVLNKEVSEQNNRNFIISFILALVIIVIGILAFYYISRGLMRPIEKLLRMSNKISEGDFSSRIELEASAEFNELAQSMNTMSERIELLIEKSIEEEKQQQKLEYKAHQAQISPHFLYNTLDAIIWAAEAKEIPKVIHLVTSLSSFFRISLSSGTDFITISDEIEHVRNYLAIQQIRYSDVLSYEIHVDKGLDEQRMLKLLLQPLVENSLYHGIRGTRIRGKITVSAVKTEGKVKFTVADNGIGMTEDKLNEVRKIISSESGGDKSYGLYSINRRLKLYYDMNDGVEINSEYRKGTEVSFTLDII